MSRACRALPEQSRKLKRLAFSPQLTKYTKCLHRAYALRRGLRFSWGRNPLVIDASLFVKLDYLIDGRVRLGSGTDLRRHHQEGLLLGVKRTYFANKRTSASECRLSGVKQTYQRHGLGVRC